jgi:8-oxo-dGTP pyrophosphatase MutT (NUDIX family)
LSRIAERYPHPVAEQLGVAVGGDRQRQVPAAASRAGCASRVSLASVSEQPYRRRTARVLLLDRSGRVLLLKFRARPPLDSAWFTPGGGVDGREPLRTAAARELREEIGLAVAPEQLGTVVAISSGHADLGWAKGLFRDDYFCHRVEEHQVDLTGMNPGERDQLVDHRWWTVADLTTTAETVYPYDLAPLLVKLAAGRIPAEPVQLPWHN